MQTIRFSLAVRPVDAPEYVLPLSVGTPVSGPDFDVTLVCENNVWQPVLTARTAAKLTELRLELVLPDMPWDDELYYFSNVRFTNDVAYVKRWAEKKDDAARDMLLLKNKAADALFAAGMVTAHRFFSELRFCEGGLTVYTDMEGKALVPGAEYRLERFILMTDGEGDFAFLERYAATVAKVNNARPARDIPVGWCSWSRYYHDVNAESLCRAVNSTGKYLSALGANIFQIDDGWQIDHTFPGKFVVDEKKFPEGLDVVMQAARENGMDFGLWLAPLIISESSRYFDELKPMTIDYVTSGQPGQRTYPFDPENEAFQKFLYEEFAALTKRYNVRYYKLDFLVFAWRNMMTGERIYGKSDYMMALFRRSLQTIRDAVGPDVTLVACGSPILECAGIFDVTRITCDIIWGQEPDSPSYWEIMHWVVKTVLYRYFYNGVVFVNDPDGLVIRDQDVGDGFDCTWAEARLWATVVALSGGSMLVNDIPDELSPARRSLVTALAPPLGAAARPVDLFETPVPSAAVTQYGEHRFVGRFHFGDTLAPAERFAAADFGLEQALVIRSWDKKVLGVVDTVEGTVRRPHSAELYHLQPVPADPCFLYADGHIFGGVNLYTACVENGAWHIERTGEVDLDGALYGWIPAGQPVTGTPVAEVPGGTVVKIREAKTAAAFTASELNPTGFILGNDAQ